MGNSPPVADGKPSSDWAISLRDLCEQATSRRARLQVPVLVDASNEYSGRPLAGSHRTRVRFNPSIR
jgi:hypothetical protein